MTTLFGRLQFNDDARPIQNITERIADESEIVRRQHDNLSAKIRVAIPASVVSFDATNQTAVVQPLIRERILNHFNGSKVWVPIPQLLDVPVCFPQGGGYLLTHPVKPGDEVQLLFNDLQIDSWWANSGIQNWNDKRRHDLSDAVAVVGFNSVPNAISDFSEDGIELRTDTRDVVLGIKDDGLYFEKGSVEITADGTNITLKFNDSNKIVIDDSGIHITGTLEINSSEYLNHTHTGVDPGAGVSGPVGP